jgi:hypothetical protein
VHVPHSSLAHSSGAAVRRCRHPDDSCSRFSRPSVTAPRTTLCHGCPSPLSGTPVSDGRLPLRCPSRPSVAVAGHISLTQPFVTPARPPAFPTPLFVAVPMHWHLSPSGTSLTPPPHRPPMRIWLAGPPQIRSAPNTFGLGARKVFELIFSSILSPFCLNPDPPWLRKLRILSVYDLCDSAGNQPALLKISPRLPAPSPEDAQPPGDSGRPLKSSPIPEAGARCRRMLSLTAIHHSYPQQLAIIAIRRSRLRRPPPVSGGRPPAARHGCLRLPSVAAAWHICHRDRRPQAPGAWRLDHGAAVCRGRWSHLFNAAVRHTCPPPCVSNASLHRCPYALAPQPRGAPP